MVHCGVLYLRTNRRKDRGLREQKGKQMISVVLVLIAAVAGLMTIGGAMAFNEKEDRSFAWATFVLLACTMALSFIAGVMS